ncbi:MAG: UpxY family transcription antiterminator [Cyclobacteriaceae bacterium]|nr:UpxY family transcription antiterminator [Cyclobacteriaceae bacterium]
MTGGNKVLEKKWLVFYTKSRAEKKTLEYLLKFGFEAWLPLYKVLRQWSDRKKKLEVPLFNSYIFVKDIEANIPEIVKVPGISWNIRHNGKPAVLQNNEYQMIQRFIASGLTIEIGSVEDLERGDKVEIMDGPLKGAVGFLSGAYNDQKFTVEVETIDQVLKVNIDKTLLKKI